MSEMNASIVGLSMGREPGVFEAIQVAEPSHKPIVDVTPGEGCLDRLNKKDGVSL
jgi:hypothetical protein